MGLQSVVKGVVSQMEKVDTMNMNVLEKWRKRVVNIAKDLSQSDDTSRQESFETAVKNVAQRFIEASVNQPDTIMYRLEPETHANRERALIEGEEILNSFQPPSPGRSQIIQTAALDDEEMLKRNLKGLNGVDNAELIEIRDHAATSDVWTYSLTRQHHREDHKQSMSKAQRAHAKLVQKLNAFPVKKLKSHLQLTAEGSIQEHSVIVGVCDMRENSEVERYLISFEDTFSDLVEMVLESDNTASLPDFWCKRHDSAKNRVTESATWWECQIASTRVVEAIMEGNRGQNRSSINETPEERKGEIRSVLRDGEYLVVLVSKDGAESGVPVDIPRKYRQRTSIHFQEKVFPNDKVDRVVVMESGLDASSMIFDKRLFDHQSNPLFVELQVPPHGAGDMGS